MSIPIPQATAGPAPFAGRASSSAAPAPAAPAHVPVAHPTPAPPSAPDRVQHSPGADVALAAVGIAALAIPVVGEIELGSLAATAGATALANVPTIMGAAQAGGQWAARGGTAEKALHTAQSVAHLPQTLAHLHKP